jgi:hypothetical protein
MRIVVRWEDDFFSIGAFLIQSSVFVIWVGVEVELLLLLMLSLTVLIWLMVSRGINILRRGFAICGFDLKIVLTKHYYL